MATSGELTESDIPGAILEEPLEKATVHALKWWLLCRGIKAPSSWRKAKLIERVREAKKDGMKVVDVDGSYLHRKQVSSSVSDIPEMPSSVPVAGWVAIENPASADVNKIPRVTHGLLYSYLADSVGRSGRGEAFRALERGFTHWSSGRLSKIEINFSNPSFCHVRCRMTPSMKQGLYKVYMLLGCEGEMAAICAATCECAAGMSASCTHISALLHALASLTPAVVGPGCDSSDEESTSLPITSYLCQWNAPKKRKESSLPVAEAAFKKHVYGRERKHELKSMADFDPRPEELRGNSNTHLKTFLGNVRGLGLGVSLLFDEECRCWTGKVGEQLSPTLPTKEELQRRVEEFKKSLVLSPQKIREIEQSTRQQSQSTLWHSVRQYRLTGSYFGLILRLKDTTSPENLVLQIMGVKRFTSESVRWGKDNEATALEQYQQHQNTSGHNGLYIAPSGFVVCESYPFLGVSPDSVVHDPTSPNPFGLVEIKCPYSARNLLPIEAGKSPNFYCNVVNSELKLKHSHPYYSQVQGLMAITERHWCDFVVYTNKGIHVERIDFDSEFWNDKLLPKLKNFYDDCLAPNIVCPVHALGLPVKRIQDM